MEEGQDECADDDIYECLPKENADSAALFEPAVLKYRVRDVRRFAVNCLQRVPNSGCTHACPCQQPPSHTPHNHRHTFPTTSPSPCPAADAHTQQRRQQQQLWPLLPENFGTREKAGSPFARGGSLIEMELDCGIKSAVKNVWFSLRNQQPMDGL